MLIVCPAAQRDRADRRRASPGIGHDVMELEPAAFCASARSSHEGALALVSRPDGPAYGGRNVSRTRGRHTAGAWPGHRRELLALELRQQERQRTVDDDREVAVGDRVTHEVLRVAQLLGRRGVLGNKRVHGLDVLLPLVGIHARLADLVRNPVRRQLKLLGLLSLLLTHDSLSDERGEV